MMHGGARTMDLSGGAAFENSPPTHIKVSHAHAQRLTKSSKPRHKRLPLRMNSNAQMLSFKRIRWLSTLLVLLRLTL